jgi:glycosyltransferase involved in cell wall biosynthesis
MAIDRRVQNNVCVVTFPLEAAASSPILNLVKILRPRTKSLYVISGGETDQMFQAKGMKNVASVTHRSYESPIKRAVSFALTNFQFLVRVIALRKRVGLFVFFIGGENLLIPMLGARLLGVKTLLMPAGDAGKVYMSSGDSLGKVLSVLTACSFFLADTLVLYSENTIVGIPLERYRHKIVIGHEGFIDFNRFSPTTSIAFRRQMVGFVGRLDKEKGILNLIHAIPMVLDKVPAEFVICGDGSLRRDVIDFLSSRELLPNVRIEGWINHEVLPRYFNEFRLLVLPSYTEGLPNVALEAMACGTPVLMTKVGALAEMATDGKEIFFLDSNDPQVIADSITSVLTDPSRLQQVSDAALNFVRTKFGYRSTSQAWDSLLPTLGIDGD